MAQQDELKRKYRVENKTNRTIFWKDGSWLSGDLPPGEARNVDSNHDADVTIYAKFPEAPGTKGDTDWGRVWILRGKALEVQGQKEWRLKEWPVDPATGMPL